jgi:hypothetical protein
VSRNVPFGAIWCFSNTVLLGAQALDTAPALVIEEMRTELDRDAIELLEGVRQQQQFALRIERAALRAWRTRSAISTRRLPASTFI